MKLQFKTQEYQTKAVQAVVDCFKGQPKIERINYQIDQGRGRKQHTVHGDDGFKNADIIIDDDSFLKNIQAVQRSQNLPQSSSATEFRVLKKDTFVIDRKYSAKAKSITPYHLDIEMETGTGKTYCYIKSIFEMNKKYGWTKFIIVVPSIAIREGVAKSFEITAEHFQQSYGKKVKSFIYNSKDLHKIEAFSSDAGINVMVINVQAFSSKPKDDASEKTILNQKNKIYRRLDDFQSRKPIDVIKANQPILILDEPQKMEGAKTLDALKEFNPLFILRYSATHKTRHNLIHRLDAVDAYNQKLVKKISVRGISVKGLSGTNAYLYLEGIEISKKAPTARLEIEVKQASGIKRIIRKVNKGDNLYDLSGELDQYKGMVVREINGITDVIEFTNGLELQAGEATGDIDATLLRRIQIRETIKAHFEKEQILFHRGIKVLSLFFIDEVVKYRDYSKADEKGEYARIFEEEYDAYLQQPDLPFDQNYLNYLKSAPAQATHKGYFSIDKKGKMVDALKTAKSEKTESTDQSAYDLILKKKEQLLSFQEPTRFIFSHSALREGWDNPNVFVICTLKHSDNTISRRQEVGRGLRISVNQHGERQDDPQTVHQTNMLTVVASESYKDFVTGLQRDISETLSARPRVADEKFFTGKVLPVDGADVEVTPAMAKQIYRYLLKNDYTDESDHITEKFHEAVKEDALAVLPEDLQPYASQIQELIASVYSDANLPQIGNDRNAKTNALNKNYEKKEFLELWNRINKKAAYTVHFDSAELVGKCVQKLNENLKVEPLKYYIQQGEQKKSLDYETVVSGETFATKESRTEYNNASVHSAVKYDLVGKISENTTLTRKTVVEILTGIEKIVFEYFKVNPESFIAQASKLIQEQKASVIIEHLRYDAVAETHDIDIFTKEQSKQDFSNAGEPLKRHIYDYVITDSKIERTFVEELDIADEVVVYAKLPKGFSIPTPVGNYNPDWAISFNEDKVKHVYFVAETKGSMSSMSLKEIEQIKTKCARKFFDEINKDVTLNKVKYEVVDSYDSLMKVVQNC